MIIPDFEKERSFKGKGYKFIAGIDEAGRGPWAGPVVAGAVVFDDERKMLELIDSGIKDSKKISEKKREGLYELIIKNCKSWAVGIVSEKIIDEINILNATKLAMSTAVEKLSVRPDFLIIDGRDTLRDYSISQLAVPKADQNIVSVSAASIIAKVTRDRILIEYDKIYPNYGFCKHKGYGTKLHIKNLEVFGPCEIHRRTFSPVKEMVGGAHVHSF